MKKLAFLLGVVLFTVSAQATIMAFRCPDATGGFVPQKSDLKIEIFSPDTAASSFMVSIKVADPVVATQVALGDYNHSFNGTSDDGIKRDGLSDLFIQSINGNMASGGTVAINETLCYFYLDTMQMAMGATITVDDFIGANPYRGAALATSFNGQSLNMASLTLTIPEPVSMVLLALGGLALRRRK